MACTRSGSMDEHVQGGDPDLQFRQLRTPEPLPLQPQHPELEQQRRTERFGGPLAGGTGGGGKEVDPHRAGGIAPADIVAQPGDRAGKLRRGEPEPHQFVQGLLRRLREEIAAVLLRLGPAEPGAECLQHPLRKGLRSLRRLPHPLQSLADLFHQRRTVLFLAGCILAEIQVLSEGGAHIAEQRYISHGVNPFVRFRNIMVQVYQTRRASDKLCVIVFYCELYTMEAVFRHSICLPRRSRTKVEPS